MRKALRRFASPQCWPGQSRNQLQLKATVRSAPVFPFLSAAARALNRRFGCMGRYCAACMTVVGLLSCPEGGRDMQGRQGTGPSVWTHGAAQ